MDAVPAAAECFPVESQRRKKKKNRRAVILKISIVKEETALEEKKGCLQYKTPPSQAFICERDASEEFAAPTKQLPTKAVAYVVQEDQQGLS